MKNVYIRIIVWCLALMPLSVSQVLAQSNETNAHHSCLLMISQDKILP